MTLRRLVARATPDPTTGGLEMVARVIPWNESTTVTDDGRTFYTEVWRPGSLVPAERVIVYDTHNPAQLAADGRQPIGRADTWDNRADGLWGRLALFDTTRARDVYATARGLDYLDVSIECEVPGASTGGVVERTAAAPCPLTGVSVVLPPHRGAYPSATAAARAEADPDNPDPDPDPDPGDEDDEPTTDEPTTDEPTEGDEMTDTATTESDTVGRAYVTRDEVAEIARAVTASRSRNPVGTPPTVLHRYGSFDEAVMAFRAAPSADAAEFNRALATASAGYHRFRRLERLVGRAWVDQITADNPGMMPPTYLTEIFGVIEAARPAISALGPTSAGDSGMSIHWPTFTGDLRTIVAAQTAEKTAIQSVKVSFGDGSANLVTYAGGSDVSYQLARRSTPSYLAAYETILNTAFGLTTEIAFEAALAAVNATADATLDLATDTDGSATKAALFAASSAVRLATGQPATVVLAASDVFAALGGSAWLQPPQYGTNNTPGTASAGTLQVSISGLAITEAPDLPDGSMIVTNEKAATWHEDGPYFVSAEDVQRLGTDVAIWGMGAPGIRIANGVYEIAVTLAPTLPLARARKSAS